MNTQNIDKRDAAVSVIRQYCGGSPLQKQFCDEVIKTYAEYPGGSEHHHAFKYGLIIHTAEVIKVGIPMVQEMTGKWESRYPFAIAALLHDYGKVEDYELKTGFYSYTKRPGYQKANHIIRSYDFFNDMGRRPGGPLYDQFDLATTISIASAILSHHGRLEWGSVTEPKTPFEWALHLADMASAMGGVVL